MKETKKKQTENQEIMVSIQVMGKAVFKKIKYTAKAQRLRNILKWLLTLKRKQGDVSSLEMGHGFQDAPFRSQLRGPKWNADAD